MILASVLRDRLDEVIADMELQFAVVAPEFSTLVEDALAGSTSARSELQALGRTTLAPLIDHYGTGSAALAADWYDLNRELAKISGSWSGAWLQDPNTDTGPLVGGVMKDFVTPESIMSGLMAGMDRRIRQTANGSIMESVLRDRQATGWARVASTGCCGFCAMLASRGATYRTRNTSTFSPHDHCKCQALPLWSSDPTGQSMRSREDTIATRRTLSDEQRARQNKQARGWIEANKDTLGLL